MLRWKGQPNVRELTTQDRISRELIESLAVLDAATLYEAAGQRGMVDPRIRPAWRGARVCGPALTVECPPRDNLMLHQAATLARPDDVIVAAVGGELRAGAWGEILTVAAQVRGIAGLVIDGAVRDIEAIEELGFPIFSRGLAIGSCTKERVGALNRPIDFGGVRVQPGDLVFGDTDGVVIIARECVEAVCARAFQRRERERTIIEELRKGKTTLELLGLHAVPPGARPQGGDA
jgi:4-hydroxy-4-methyl-2-oxoglutarate aldolase